MEYSSEFTARLDQVHLYLCQAAQFMTGYVLVQIAPEGFKGRAVIEYKS